MPTGYTSKLYDGTPQTFSEFVLSCARAFGALVEMRDDPMDAKIPDEFKPSDYSVRALAEAQKRIKRLRVTTESEAETQAAKQFKELLDGWTKAEQGKREKEARYRAMLVQVKAWNPPTEDHAGLKTFMVEQLTQSIEFDCGQMWAKPVKLSGREWLNQQIEQALASIERDGKYAAEERERAEGRTAWVRALKESINAR